MKNLSDLSFVLSLVTMLAMPLMFAIAPDAPHVGLALGILSLNFRSIYNDSKP